MSDFEEIGVIDELFRTLCHYCTAARDVVNLVQSQDGLLMYYQNNENVMKSFQQYVLIRHFINVKNVTRFGFQDFDLPWDVLSDIVHYKFDATCVNLPEAIIQTDTVVYYDFQTFIDCDSWRLFIGYLIVLCFISFDLLYIYLQKRF